MKGIYKKKSADNTTNAGVLGVFLLIFNLHSLFVLLECFMNVKIGLLEFWEPGENAKVGLGYVGGFFISVIYLLLFGFVKKYTSEKERFFILRNIVRKGRRRSLSIFYTLFSLLLFAFMILLLIITIIPEGGKI